MAWIGSSVTTQIDLELPTPYFNRPVLPLCCRLCSSFFTPAANSYGSRHCLTFDLPSRNRTGQHADFLMNAYICTQIAFRIENKCFLQSRFLFMKNNTTNPKKPNLYLMFYAESYCPTLSGPDREMSWAEEDWTVGLSGRVLQKVKELQVNQERLSRESKQKQLQLDNIHTSLEKQTSKVQAAMWQLCFSTLLTSTLLSHSHCYTSKLY